MERVAIDTVWVLFAGCLVLLMQAGFATLEVGLTRMKHAGAIVAKILVNLAFALATFWAIGFAIASGDGSDFAGATGWFIEVGNPDGVASLAYSAVDEPTKFFFQATFAAVALAIVWGTMLDRTKFGSYLPFAIVFVGVIYPLIAHWVWGGGWLAQQGYLDFAGAGVVHVAGASAALAGAIVIGPRIGKYRDGRPTPIPGHSMPLAIVGILILWVGWMGFNAGSFLAAVDVPIGRVIVVTNLAGAFGVIGAAISARLIQKTLDIGMMGNGAIAGLGAIAGACAFVPDGVEAGLVYSGSLSLLGWQLVGWACIAAFSFTASGLVFVALKKTVGLRATEEQELAGLDISEHGMFGYPERFIEVTGAEPEEPADWHPRPLVAPAAVSTGSPDT